MRNPQKIKNAKKERRKARVRAKVFGTKEIPRLNVFRSLKHISVQLIDDEKGKTLIAINDKSLNKKEIKGNKNTKIEIAYEVGKLLAQKALEKKIKICVFDKSSYKYHGRVKAVAEGARSEGLQF